MTVLVYTIPPIGTIPYLRLIFSQSPISISSVIALANDAVMLSSPTTTNKIMGVNASSDDNIHDAGGSQHMKRKSTTGMHEEERECEDVTPASKRPRDNSSSASTAMSSPLKELSTNASFPTQSMVNDYTSTDAKEHGADHGAVASEGLRFSAGNDDESHVNRRPLQDINGIETSSTADEKPPPKKRLNTKFICSQILEDLLESNASPEFLEEASLLFLNTLIPDIEKADDDIKQDLEVFHEMIVNDGGSCLDRLLYLYGYFNMEHHFTLLHAELEKEGQSAEALFTDGVKERIVASFIREGEAAKKNNEYCFVLKGCKEKESDEDLYNGEAIAPIPNPIERYTVVFQEPFPFYLQFVGDEYTAIGIFD